VKYKNLIHSTTFNYMIADFIRLVYLFAIGRTPACCASNASGLFLVRFIT